MKPELTILRDRYVRGWPSHNEGDRVYPCSLERALTREYSSDAHFAAYTSPLPRRLTSGAVGGTGITMHVIVFDVDDPTTHGSSEPACDEWREEQSSRCRRLEREHPAAFFYDTRGGYRCVYRLQEPSVISSPQDAVTWRQEYAVIREYLLRRFDIAVDAACSDWTRLFRLPRATRDPDVGPERRSTYGDPCNIGRLHVRAEPCDLEAARAASKAFREPRSYAFTGSSDGTQGLLFHALKARGDVLREHGANAFVIRCPNHEQHTSGRTGDGSTVLYPPAPGEHVGAIHCLHAHCARLTVRDWVRLFTRSELEAAEQTANCGRAA
jgi:hypothetical protein